MRKLASKVLASVTSLAMAVAFCPVAPALADDAATYTATQATGVNVRVNATAGKAATLYRDMTVNSDDAYNAGFTEFDDPATVTLGDVLVAVHKKMYKEPKFSTDSTATDAQLVIALSYGSPWTFRIFDSGNSCSFWVNNKFGMTGIFDTPIANGDLVTAGLYQSSDYSDSYVYMTTSKDEIAGTVTAKVISPTPDASYNYTDQPVAGATVTLTAAGASEPAATATTDDEGNATFSDVKGAYTVAVADTAAANEWLPPVQGVTCGLEQGYYDVDILGAGSMVNVDSSNADDPGVVYVDENGNASLLVRVYTPNKYDYLWHGSLDSRPDPTETKNLIKGIPIPAEKGYEAAQATLSANMLEDKNGDYYGVAGAWYKAQLYIIPLTDDEFGRGDVPYQIRRSAWSPSNQGKWMGTSERSITFAFKSRLTTESVAAYSLEDIEDVVATTAAIPENPTAADIDAYALARYNQQWFIGESKTTSQTTGVTTSSSGKTFYYPYTLANETFMAQAIPEVAEILDFANTAIPNVVPADGDYTFLANIASGTSYGVSEDYGTGSRLPEAVLHVADGRMTLELTAASASYPQAFMGTPARAGVAEDAAAGNPDNIEGIYKFSGKKLTVPIESLEKPTVMGWRSSSSKAWFFRIFTLHASNMDTVAVIELEKTVNGLLNDPADDPATEAAEVPNKIDPTKMTAEKLAAAAETLKPAYEALSASDKASFDATVIANLPNNGATQTYGEAVQSVLTGKLVDACADAVAAMSALTDSSDEATVVAARAAYGALSPARQALISSDVVAKLTSAEKAVAAAKKAAEDAAAKKAAEEAAAKKAAEEAAAAEAAKAKVKNVTVNVKTVNAKAIKAAITKAGGDAKYVTTITLGKKVKKIAKGAFKSCKAAKTLVVKTTKLKKGTVKGSLKGSAVKTVKVPKKKLKAYKKIFTKKIAGKKVKVKK